MEIEVFNWIVIFVGIIVVFFMGWVIFSFFMFGKIWVVGLCIFIELFE